MVDVSGILYDNNTLHSTCGKPSDHQTVIPLVTIETYASDYETQDIIRVRCFVSNEKYTVLYENFLESR